MNRLFAAAIGVAATVGMMFGPASADAPKPGGSIVVTFQSDMATLDPMVGYDWSNWGLIKVLFDQLMDYVPGTGELTTDLAESFEVSPDGLVYTFKLRQGVKFHNGREMAAADMKYSLDRMANPATQCPGASYYDAIVGFADAMAGTAPGLAGVTAVDDYTLKIELSRPDAAFLHKLALNFTSAVPQEEVEKYGPDFGHNPVGTGAFKMTEWIPGQRIVFERNPDYYIAGRPLLDQVVFEVGQDPSVAMLRLERGEVDYVADGVPPARFVEVRDNPDNKDKLIEGPQMQTGYVTLNTRVAPFDDVRVRKAVNMAIDKDRIIKLINGRAEPANQPLPPAMPGHDNDYAGYPYDPDGAKALLAEAGYPDGFD
ncbi:MAG: ABC transporter substrate-binding protein, partial [Alphaproteobacteria bacterium]|nr:ABC transporter substrate-binding protein [Alphaproteobacteria bacterium]